MIEYLDNLLRHLLISEIDEITDEAQVSFQPPDDAWRTYVASLTVNALNVYLTDLRENRKLRSNERVRSVEKGVVSEDPAPARIDCHYLISAWSPAAVTTAIEPTLDEHALLYETAAVLFRTKSFNPSGEYPAGSVALNNWPERFRDVDLPIVVAPVEGFNKLSEFWSSMGQGTHWKPVIYLVVTLPVELLMEVAGPVVTTRITEYRFSGNPETAEVSIQIGGYALNNTVSPPVPVANAWVRLEDAGGTPQQTSTTDSDGRFTFRGLAQGNYTLRIRAQGFTQRTQSIQVPSLTGDYDVRLS